MTRLPFEPFSPARKIGLKVVAKRVYFLIAESHTMLAVSKIIANAADDVTLAVLMLAYLCRLKRLLSWPCSRKIVTFRMVCSANREVRIVIPSKGIAALLGTALAVLVASEALANDAETCNGGIIDKRLLGAQIAACTREINSGRLLGDELARIYWKRGISHHALNDYRNAKADYDEAIRINPRYPLAYAGRAGSWKMLNDLDRAIADYTRAIELQSDPNPRSDYYFGRGHAYLRKNDYARAIVDYSASIRDYPSANMYVRRGEVFKDSGDLDRALADYNEAIRLKPDYARAIFLRGDVSKATSLEQSWTFARPNN